MDVELYLRLRSEISDSLGALLILSQEAEEPAESIRNLRGLISNLDQPFLFVVVGEVKAGKSSLLNALFGQNFCKVDVLPATDKVHVFKYGEKEYDALVSDALTERYRPIEFLKNFNIVDTPGTNTIVASHQEITIDFVPMADLIVFVFSVVNPWAASAWEFLKLLKNQWRKNIVFVLQQEDLRSHEEVEIIKKHLDQTILQILGTSRPIFAVSARRALEVKLSGKGEEDPLWEQSHFGQLEDYISSTVAQSEERGGKLRSVAETALVVADGIEERLQDSVKIVKADQEKLALIRSDLDSRKEQSLRQIGGFIREMELAYDGCLQRGEKLLEQRLGVGQTLRMIFSGGKWEKDFQDQVETDVKTKMQVQIEHALELLEADLGWIWQNLQDKVRTEFESEARQNRGIVPGFIQKRGAVLQRLQLTLLEQVSDAKIREQLQKWFGETARGLRIPASVLAAGGVATLIAVMAHAAIIDFTGSVAGIAAVSGTAYALFRRQKVMREYRRRMNDKRAELVNAVQLQLRNAISAFYHEVQQTFVPLETFCETQAARHRPLLQRVEEVKGKLNSIKSNLA